ncbi:dolichyldiphosphatase 1-like [Phlebotomus argentipes]|uniref:dolichyldiphosphatase 1-like n=1 Tax=Phlebotomus argentipes TaxID=94469 RepID=UPI0028933645|nr:dolichyldiphosphatase 1-like [Phlebotomus argentipes]
MKSPHDYEEYNSSDWVPITLTLVEYPRGDLIGELLAWLSLMPMVLLAGFITLILFRRDLHTISFFLGMLLNEFFNKILKHTIQEPRPVLREHPYTEYGMPSSHSQFMCFFSTYVLLFVLIRLHHMNNNAPLERAMRILVLAACWITTALVCYGRIYLQYHTAAQVYVGAAVGICTGALWFTVIHFFLTPYFPRIVTWKVSEFLLLRDTTLIPNVLWFEYTVTRQEARARSRKLISMKSQ